MMNKQPRIAVFGGDSRQIFVAKRLMEDGFKVCAWGLGDKGRELLGDSLCENPKEALRDAEILLLPLPTSLDGVRLHCPLRGENESLRLSILLEEFSGHVLLGGRIPQALQGLAEQRGIVCIDYFDSEILQLKNALPTAEGAIAIAMRELPVTMDGCETAVIGYGRIGSLLAEKLYALGALVTVFARRREVLTQAELRHHKTVLLRCRDGYRGLEQIPPDCRVIFNTVPQRIFVGDALKKIPHGCLFVDLASAPGGIDFEAAEKAGIHAIWATALPGKYAPESAGEIIAQTVETILNELHQDEPS